jgi:hypothetical protein
MSTEFETESVDVEVYDDKILGEYGRVQPIRLKWSLDFELRSWGVKSVYVTVPDQKVLLVFDRYDEATDTDVDEEREVLLQNVQVDLDATNWDSGLSPHSLEFYEGKVIAHFGRTG